MPAIVTSWSFFTTSRRSSSRSLLKRPVTRCFTGWTSGASRARAASSTIMSSSLVGSEHRAVDQLVHQRADPAALSPRAIDDAGDVVPVAEGHVASDGIAGELLGEVFEEAGGVVREHGLELQDAGEGPAVGQRARGVDLRPELEADADERVDGAARGIVARPDRPVAGALAADHIEGFERPAGRVDLRMAIRAAGEGAVLLELLADC